MGVRFMEVAAASDGVKKWSPLLCRWVPRYLKGNLRQPRLTSSSATPHTHGHQLVNQIFAVYFDYDVDRALEKMRLN